MPPVYIFTGVAVGLLIAGIITTVICYRWVKSVADSQHLSKIIHMFLFSERAVDGSAKLKKIGKMCSRNAEQRVPKQNIIRVPKQNIIRTSCIPKYYSINNNRELLCGFAHKAKNQYTSLLDLWTFKNFDNLVFNCVPNFGRSLSNALLVIFKFCILFTISHSNC